MDRTQKEQVVAELAERLRSTESLIVADYRGLTNAELRVLRGKLRGSGAQLQVVKNTLTRRAAEAAGTESVLALLEGPTAIAFIETDGDPVAVAKALADTAKETKVMSLRGGILSGRSITGSDVEELAKLPAADVVKSQLVGVIVAPLTQLVGLLAAPLQDLVGLIDARIAQLEEGGDTSGAEAAPAEEAEPATEEHVAEAPAEVAEEPERSSDEPTAEATGDEPTAEATGDEPTSEAEPEAAAEGETETENAETEE
jgi:large subunit ribosomal protein L10